MTIQADLWHLVGLLLGFIATLSTFGLILLRQIDHHISIQALRLTALEKEFSEYKAHLPLEYQRREDAIRIETNLIARMETIYVRLERINEKAHDNHRRD